MNQYRNASNCTSKPEVIHISSIPRLHLSNSMLHLQASHMFLHTLATDLTYLMQNLPKSPTAVLYITDWHRSLPHIDCNDSASDISSTETAKKTVHILHSLQDNCTLQQGWCLTAACLTTVWITLSLLSMDQCLQPPSERLIICHVISVNTLQLTQHEHL